MGLRSKRFSMVVHNGVVQVVNLETSGDDLEVRVCRATASDGDGTHAFSPPQVSDGESMIKVLRAWRARLRCQGPIKAKHTLTVQAQKEAQTAPEAAAE